MLSDDEIYKLFAKSESLPKFARAIIAAHNAKLLAGVEMHEPVAEIRLNMTGGNAGLATHIVQIADGYFPAKTKLFTKDQLLTYAAAAAAQARVKALDEAKQACLQKHANGNWKHDTREECADAIE